MKKIILTSAFVSALALCTQAQTDKASRPAAAPGKQEQPAAEKVNPDGSVDKPVPASMATPETMPQPAKKSESPDTRPAPVQEKRPAGQKPAAPKAAENN